MAIRRRRPRRSSVIAARRDRRRCGSATPSSSATVGPSSTTCRSTSTRGEIVGVAGVEGNGQAELADVLGSLLALDAGSVEVDGSTVPTGRAGEMGEAGIGLIPEDRHDAGCVLALSVAENLALGELGRGAALGASIVRPGAGERSA